MQSIKSVFFKPDPAEQKQKCNSLIRRNIRALDRDIANLKATESKTRSLIVASSKRGQKNPSQAKQADLEVRTYARAMIQIRKQASRLHTSKAQLQSVMMQVNEAFAVRSIETGMKTSTGIMKQVNTLVKLPELTGTMQELSQELMRAGIIEEMMGDMLPDGELLEDEEEEAETEVDKVLAEVLKGKLPDQQLPSLPARQEDEEEDVEEREAELAQMRGRLEALKS